MKNYIILSVLLPGVLAAKAQGKLADTTRFFRLAQQMLLTKHLVQVDASVYREFNSNKVYALRDFSILEVSYFPGKTLSCQGADSAIVSIVKRGSSHTGLLLCTACDLVIPVILTK